MPRPGDRKNYVTPENWKSGMENVARRQEGPMEVNECECCQPALGGLVPLAAGGLSRSFMRGTDSQVSTGLGRNRLLLLVTTINTVINK